MTEEDDIRMRAVDAVEQQRVRADPTNPFTRTAFYPTVVDAVDAALRAERARAEKAELEHRRLVGTALWLTSEMTDWYCTVGCERDIPGNSTCIDAGVVRCGPCKITEAADQWTDLMRGRKEDSWMTRALAAESALAEARAALEQAEVRVRLRDELVAAAKDAAVENTKLRDALDEARAAALPEGARDRIKWAMLRKHHEVRMSGLTRVTGSALDLTEETLADLYADAVLAALKVRP